MITIVQNFRKLNITFFFLSWLVLLKIGFLCASFFLILASRLSLPLSPTRFLAASSLLPLGRVDLGLSIGILCPNLGRAGFLLKLLLLRTGLVLLTFWLLSNGDRSRDLFLPELVTACWVLVVGRFDVAILVLCIGRLVAIAWGLLNVCLSLAMELGVRLDWPFDRVVPRNGEFFLMSLLVAWILGRNRLWGRVSGLLEGVFTWLLSLLRLGRRSWRLDCRVEGSRNWEGSPPLTSSATKIWSKIT